MRTVTVVESTRSYLDLSTDEAEELQRLGARLASRKEWWGQSESDDTDRSVIRCRPAAGNLWELRVSDAVGLVSLKSLQIIVEPKIPTSHVLHLFSRSGAFPRMEEQRGAAAIGESLFELVATWFINATERVLRRGLVRDYEIREDDLSAVRGSLHVMETARHYYSGRLTFACSFEEFGYDSPLNRAVWAAARVVGGSPALPWATRRRALAVQARMEEVGEFRSSDNWPALDRRTAHYRDSLLLAGHILRSQNRDLQHGNADAWTFLIKTPDMVEAGLRAILQEAFGKIVHKSLIQLENSSMTLNPDLVVGNSLAVADVKYKLAREDWDRPDLYQTVAFATGFRTTQAAIVGFSKPGRGVPEPTRLGDVTVQYLAWPADEAISPRVAHEQFVASFRMWLKSINVIKSAVA